MSDPVRDFYHAVENGDEALLRAVLSPEWEEVPMVYPGQPAGPEGYLPIVAAFKAAFPDVRFDIHEMLASGDKVTVRTTIRGTHRGEWLGIAATGKPIAVDAIDIHHVANGRVIRSWHIEDWFRWQQAMRA